MEQSPFLVKICQLEQDYQTLEDCLRACRDLEEADIDLQLRRVWRAYREASCGLEEAIRSSRSPAMRRLAQAQHTYDRTVQALLEETLPADLHSEGTTPGEDRTEARMLCAEYAVDFARQAVRRAYENLYADGGCIAQCEFGPGGKPENVRTVFEEWENLTARG